MRAWRHKRRATKKIKRIKKIKKKKKVLIIIVGTRDENESLSDFVIHFL